MAINLTVNASVVDIRKPSVVDIHSDTPSSSDIFLVDTNVWYWMTYQRASSGDQPPKSYQTNQYPSYISQALSMGSRLIRRFQRDFIPLIVRQTQDITIVSSILWLSGY
jgi:hypothetical protein